MSQSSVTNNRIVFVIFVLLFMPPRAEAQSKATEAPANSGLYGEKKSETVPPGVFQRRPADSIKGSTQSEGMPSPIGGIPLQDDWLYESDEAQQLVMQARTSDPLYCPIAQSDRSSAIRCYEAAIKAQPGAPANAAIANRIAQLLAFSANPAIGLKPDPVKAAQWWDECRLHTDSTQLLWAQSLMGSASTQVMTNSLPGSIAAYNQILEIDPESLRLNAWQRNSTVDDPGWRHMELQRLKRELLKMQGDARRNIQYIQTAMSTRQAIKKSTGSVPVPSRRWIPIVVLNVTAISLSMLGYVYYRRRRVR
jgi:tetratricopeptide (TPR) repeat protein